MGQVLSSVEIDTSLVASHVTVLKSYPFIGLMGYSAGETPLSYPETDFSMVQVLGMGCRILIQTHTSAKKIYNYLIFASKPQKSMPFASIR